MIDDIKISQELSQQGTIDVVRYIHRLGNHAKNSDPFTSCNCKRELYILKNFINDLYVELPEFPQQEKEWEQSRLMELLKR